MTQPQPPNPSPATIPSPVLLIGTGGMLARAWTELLAQHGLTCDQPTLAELDLTQPESIRRVFTDRYRLVINCAAWTDVDGAEAHPEAARQVNGIGVGHLAQRARDVGATLVHYSTDYVFSGQATQPYPVGHPRQPMNVYGQTKALGEELLQAAGGAFLLVRTSWLYAPWNKNFVRTIAQAARQKPVLKVVSDQRGRPTSAEHLARTTLALLARKAQGIYHVTDGGECSWFEFAQRIVDLTGAACRVEPCNSDQYPRPARRPAYSVLDLSATEALVGPMPCWESNLADVIKRME